MSYLIRAAKNVATQQEAEAEAAKREAEKAALQSEINNFQKRLDISLMSPQQKQEHASSQVEEARAKFVAEHNADEKALANNSSTGDDMDFDGGKRNKKKRRKKSTKKKRRKKSTKKKRRKKSTKKK